MADTKHNQIIVTSVGNNGIAPLAVDQSSILWQLIESSSDGLGVLDHNFRLIACNNSFASGLGYSVDEMIGKYAWEWDATYDSKQQFIEEVSSAGYLPDKIETTHARKDGTILDIEIAITSTSIDSQGVYMFVSKDITQQKEEKRSLLQTRFAMDNARDNCTWFDSRGTIIYANNSACTTLGYSPKELIGKTIKDINPDLSNQGFNDFIVQLKQRGSLLFESTHITKDKVSYPVEISANYFKDGDDFYICVFDRDITQRKISERALKKHSKTLEENVIQRTAELSDEIERRKQYETALEERKATFKALAENSLDVIMRYDRDYKHLYVNPAIRLISSYKPDELIGKSFSELEKSKSLAPFLNSALEKVFSTGKSHQIEFVLPSGIWIESLLSPEIDKNGMVKAVVTTSRDITIHKKTLKKLNIYNQLQLLLTDLASTFINLPLQETTPAVNKALAEIASFVKADQAFIFHYDFVHNKFLQKYVFSKQNSTPAIRLPRTTLREFITAKEGQKVLHIADASKLEPEHMFYDFMSQSGMRSMIIVPMKNGKEITGCVGFQTYSETHDFSEHEQQLLTVFAQLLVNIDKRNETDKALRAQHAYQEIIASIAVRFVAANETNLSELIQNTLNQLGSFFQFDRSAFFYHDFVHSGKVKTLDIIRDTNNHSANSIEPDIHPVIKTSLEQNDSLFKNQTIFHFPNTQNINDKHKAWQQHFIDSDVKSAIYMSCKTDRKVFGILGFEMIHEQAQWSQAQINGLVIIAQIFGYTLANLEARKALLAAKDNLETRVSDRTKELILQMKAKEKAMEDLAKAQTNLLEASRSAGMAEVATNVLHNVGNVLNSINVSCNLLMTQLQQSRLSNFSKVSRMLHDNKGNYAQFLTADEKGKHIPEYLISLGPQLDKEHQTFFDEVTLLSSKIDHVKKIISMQQGYGRVQGVNETFSPKNLFDDALSLSTSVLNKYNVKVRKQYEEVPHIVTDKHKILQILLNLITNAGNSFEENPETDNNVVTLSLVTHQKDSVRFIIEDNGRGIEEDNLGKIFQHGFTTRKQGHGFGLHSGALSARQLGGTLSAQSKGPGHGATFILELPIQHIETVL